MKCSNCGSEIQEDSLFCEYCGARIDVTHDSSSDMSMKPVNNVESSQDCKDIADNNTPEYEVINDNSGASKKWIVIFIIAGLCLLAGLCLYFFYFNTSLDNSKKTPYMTSGEESVTEFIDSDDTAVDGDSVVSNKILDTSDEKSETEVTQSKSNDNIQNKDNSKDEEKNKTTQNTVNNNSDNSKNLTTSSFNGTITVRDCADANPQGLLLSNGDSTYHWDCCYHVYVYADNKLAEDFSVTSSDTSVCSVQKDGDYSFIIKTGDWGVAAITVTIGKSNAVFYWKVYDAKTDRHGNRLISLASDYSYAPCLLKWNYFTVDFADPVKSADISKIKLTNNSTNAIIPISYANPGTTCKECLCISPSIAFQENVTYTMEIPAGTIQMENGTYYNLPITATFTPKNEYKSISFKVFQDREGLSVSDIRIKKDESNYYFEITYDNSYDAKFYIFPAGYTRSDSGFKQEFIKKSAGVGTVVLTSSIDNIENNVKNTSSFVLGVAVNGDDRMLCTFTIPTSLWKQ